MGESTGGQPAILRALSSKSEWVVSGLLTPWVVPSFHSFISSRLFRKIMGVLLPKRAWKTGHNSPVCPDFPVDCRSRGGNEVVEETISRGCPAPVLSAQPPPWKPGLCCLVAVPQDPQQPKPHMWWMHPQSIENSCSDKWTNPEFDSYVGQVQEWALPLHL